MITTLTRSCSSLLLPSIIRKHFIHIASPGKGETSKYEVQFLLNVYCFSTIYKVQKSLSHTICKSGTVHFNHFISSLIPCIKCSNSSSCRFYEDLQDILELTPKKDVIFIIGDWNAKVGCQEIPGVTGKFSLGVWNDVEQRLIEFCQENTLVIANIIFQQHGRQCNTWTSPDGQHWNLTDYVLCSQKWRSSIQSEKTRPGADWGSDHELFITNSNLNWRK